jgi:hypothetical protein
MSICLLGFGADFHSARLSSKLGGTGGNGGIMQEQSHHFPAIKHRKFLRA